MRTILGLVLLVAAAPLFALEASNVLVVANEKVHGSTEIAEYYADLRGIPREQILKISASKDEEISRADFNETIWEPVKKYVLERDNILAIVPTRGVPLKIKQEKQGAKEAFKGRDFASVDGELALIRYGDYDIDGVVQNPILDSKERITLESKILVVCRLDGPTIEIAKGLVEKAILAEALGCHGESFLDTRGLTTNDGYQQRDDIMEKVEDSWKAAGLKYVHDTDGKVFDLSSRPDTLHYYGWYAGNPNAWKGDVKFRTGGICIHLHSFAGSTVRDIKRNWVAPLLNWGATATYGTTYEPYTTGFPYEHIFWDRLISGWTFGEAGQVASHLLSWQAVFCGDPLYTPYPEGYSDKQARYRQALLARLVPSQDTEPTPIDETGLSNLGAAETLLKARADALQELVRKDAKAALEAFNLLRFIVQDMGVEAWISSLSKPFEAALEARLKEIEAVVKDDVTNTAALEAAIVDWKGLPVHEQARALYDEVKKDQDKDAEKLLKKAQAYRDSGRWMKAWQHAAEAAAHRLSDSATAADEILTGLKANAEAVEEMKSETDKELQPVVEKAQKELDKGKADRAAKTLGREWRYLFTEADQYVAAAALAKKIEEALGGGK